jgi:hypothetical protein
VKNSSAFSSPNPPHAAALPMARHREINHSFDDANQLHLCLLHRVFSCFERFLILRRLDCVCAETDLVLCRKLPGICEQVCVSNVLASQPQRFVRA